MTYSDLPADLRTVARAIALRWTWTTQTHTLDILRALDESSLIGKRFNGEAVKAAIGLLRGHRLIENHPNRDGHFRLIGALRCVAYRELLSLRSPADIRSALLGNVSPYGDPLKGYSWNVYEQGATVSVVRLLALLGQVGELERVRALTRHLDWRELIGEALLQPFDPADFAQLTASAGNDVVIIAMQSLCAHWNEAALPVARWLQQQPLALIQTKFPAARLYLAEWLLHRGDHERMLSYLDGDSGTAANAMRAAALVQMGRWAEGQAAFEATFKPRAEQVGQKKRLYASSLAWYYPLALIAQQTQKSVTTARKFVLGESGSRTPAPDDFWGRWAHVLGVRLGEHPADTRASVPAIGRYLEPDLGAFWQLLLLAWAGNELGELDRDGLALQATRIAARLSALDMPWLSSQAQAAGRVIAGNDAPAGFFVGGGQERWRTVLSALQALGEDGPGAGTGSKSARDSVRLLWAVRRSRDERVEAIFPLEQKRGARGWSKPKEVSLARLVGNATLAPQDAKIVQAVRSHRLNKRDFFVDRAAAMIALIGHPAVVVEPYFDTLVDVVAGTPEVEVVREAGHQRVRVTPDPMVPDANAPEYFYDDAQAREYADMRAVVVVQDSPQRLRVIRFSPAQRRAAQLLADGLAVPETAQSELQGALRALATHFSVHADEVAAAREVATESRLRAELSPVGDGLLLRVVAAPLGPEGPRLMPGCGRESVAASLGSERLGSRRDLAEERAHLDALLDRLPFLSPPQRGDSICEWSVDDPELALSMVEILPQLQGVVATDWPRGKPVRVASIDLAQLQMSVKSGRDWFRLGGGVALDEGRIFALEQLLAASAQRTRFIALGDGQYLALSHALRERLQSLAAVIESDKEGIRAPLAAGAWLDDTLEGIELESDASFRERLGRLQEARALEPVLPNGLQAELRAYQEDGYAWAIRLCAAGFGAVLADDMGLGKTVQAIAVLLNRAAGGPALVVAPTSLCGNWKSELERFSPSLRVSIYGEGERDGLAEGAVAGDVIVVSYTLMQLAGDRFAGRTWHTLIADEAQAVKNAATKRSQALFDLDADFRMALSGTPVENRLAELWSVMRFCNPGLLGSLARFNERFAGPIERERDREAQRLLRRLIAPFVLRRTKGQVLQELPPRTELALAITPEADELAHYEALRRQAITEAERAAATGDGRAKLNILAQLTKLRRAACDPRLVTPGFAPGAKVRAFAELAAELTANGHKTLVFSQFVDFLSLLREPLDAAGIRYQYLDGATPPAERTRRVAAFQAGEGELFLISLKAGGFGLNLTAADYVVITDPWWNPAAEDQAMGRAHRMGQLRPVTVYRLVGKGTLEERIVDLHHDKRALAEGVLGEGAESTALPSADELIALMRG
ncbi:MAG: DEAD/DEAH box helicase [Rhodocyclaceae bacterium]|nr:DEAD/DEAH box helicase [Rhodocyclaceae bacterium]